MTTQSIPSNHDRFYRQARAYDIAFSWRNVAKECAFLGEVARRHGRGDPRSFLELAAGPAEHAIEMAKRGARSAALDLSPAMLAYGLEKARSAGATVAYHEGDMREFTLPDKKDGFDLAVLLMSSCSYLLTNEDVYRNFRAVASHLAPGGLYLIEMAHPRDVFKSGKSCTCDWVLEKDGMKVHTQWGGENDVFDPIADITQCFVRLTVTENGKTEVLEETAPQRGFIWTEFTALVDASQVFELTHVYGSMDVSVPFDNRKESWRMVPVLRKK